MQKLYQGLDYDGIDGARTTAQTLRILELWGSGRGGVKLQMAPLPGQEQTLI